MYPNYYIDSLVSDSNNPVYFQRYCRKKTQGNTGQNKYFLVAEYLKSKSINISYYRYF